MLLEGLHIPLTTPFHADGRLNTHKLAANVARYSKTPASGLILLSPSGEPTLLSDDETRVVLRTAAQSAAPEKVLIAGISRDSVNATLALANFAAEQNYDAILIGAPSFLASAPNSAEIITYFRTIADRAPLPTVLLSTGARTLSIDAIGILAAHPGIVGLLTTDSAAEIPAILARTAAVSREVTVTPTFAPVTLRMQLAAAASNRSVELISASSLTGAAAVPEPDSIPQPLRTRKKSVGFQIIPGHTAVVLSSLREGATAVAPAFAASAPQACYEVFAAWKDNDQPLAEEKQSRLVEAARLVEASPAALKYASDLNGYYGGPPRLPHLPLTSEQRTDMEQIMKPLRS